MSGVVGLLVAVVLIIVVVLGVLFVASLVLSVVVESRQQRIARERAQAEARMHYLTHTTMQRMYETARQAQRRQP